MGLFIGLDIGSVSVNTAILDAQKRLIKVFPYIRHFGEPIKVVKSHLAELNSSSESKIEGIAVTGSGGKLLSRIAQIPFINELVAQTAGVQNFYKDAQTIIEIGGEDSKFINVATRDYAMNELCAAGTGSFLDQQASRLGLSIEEFADLALCSKTPPRIAGRCSVFAKTDMIHLQQVATPDYDIVAGLCYALARNYISNIAKGKKFIKPLIFQGGVAYNKGMVRAFKELLNLNGKELIVPKHCASMGAIGAALVSIDNTSYVHTDINIGPMIEKLDNYLKNYTYKSKAHQPLALARSKLQYITKGSHKLNKSSKIDAFIGIDVGSISTNVVAIDRDKNLIAHRYLMTAGHPIEAVRKGIKEIGQEIENDITVIGVGVTGSGRYLIGDFVGADTVINEITSQARAAIEIDSSVDTIFEIGGQDSKYISLENGAIVDFEMNKVCAAGTGSFLEEQSEKLSLKIEDFGDIALRAKCPIDLGERCTVFMETNLVSHQQKGAEKADLVSGLAYSIVTNYLNRVVGKKKVGNRIFFQGAVAFNKGVVAAFEQVTGKPITVPPNHHVTGAIGAAIIAQENERTNKSGFRGFDAISEVSYTQDSFECDGCPNACEIKRVVVGNETPLFYGGRCEKYEIRKDKAKAKDEIPDLFAEREIFLLNSYSKTHKPKDAKIGIPYTALFHEYYPFFNTLFSELGFEVVLSDKTNKKIIYDGLSSAVAETCFPIKVAHGHVLNLINKGVDYLFLPSIIDMPPPKGIKRSFSCPYIQEIPDIIKAAINTATKILNPILHFRLDYVLEKELIEFGNGLGKNKNQVKKAIAEAKQTQHEFYTSIERRGKEVLASLNDNKTALVIVSRPYNTCDQEISFHIAKKLRDLGVLAIPADYLSLNSVDISEDWPDMYWKYGYKILGAARLIKADPRLHAVYISNFGCGPDSFITQFFRKEMAGKPYLQIEVDEHSADAGVITRCEAFLDSLRNAKWQPTESKRIEGFQFKKESGRTIYVPHMGDHAIALVTAFRATGIRAELLISDDETLELGRKYTLGKECYPCIITTGDMLKVLKHEDPKRVAFFMPRTRGPCRFGQYNKLQRMILDELGYEDVPILSPGDPESRQFYKEYDMFNTRGLLLFQKALQGFVTIDYLDKMLRQTRPYEIKKGESDTVYNKYLARIRYSIVNGGVGTILTQARKDFETIPIEYNGKPKIGIIGEIFVRQHAYSNNNIVKKVEELGGEAILPSVHEWGLHTNATRKLDIMMERKYFSYIPNYILGRILKHYDQSSLRQVKGFLRSAEETRVDKIWNYAGNYLIKWFGESALSIGNAVNWTKRGEIDGVINVMPFTCLPGTIVTAALKRFKEDYGLPVLNIAYDGLEQATIETRLEIFMYQAKEHVEAERKSRAGGAANQKPANYPS